MPSPLPSISLALMNLHHSLSSSTTHEPPTSYKSYFITSSPLPAITNARQPPAVSPRDQAAGSTGSNSLLPSEIVTTSRMLCSAHSPSGVRPRLSTLVQTQLVRTGNPFSWNSGPPFSPFQLTFTRKRQSHLSTSSISMGPTFTMSLLAFNTEAFNAPKSEIRAHSHCQMMISEKEQGPARMHFDLQSASKVPDEKRKRNVIATPRFWQRLRMKEQETSNENLNLQTRLRETIGQKTYYQ